jgi:hypothetical protein
VCRNFDLKTNIMVLWTENLFIVILSVIMV